MDEELGWSAGKDGSSCCLVQTGTISFPPISSCPVECPNSRELNSMFFQAFLPDPPTPRSKTSTRPEQEEREQHCDQAPHTGETTPDRIRQRRRQAQPVA